MLSRFGCLLIEVNADENVKTVMLSHMVTRHTGKPAAHR